jgi:hypothetical protein
LSRFTTAEGAEDLALPATAASAVPAAEDLSPLLGWGDADLVYVTYGKIWFPLFLAFTLCALVIYRQRRPGQWETWIWRVTLTGYVLACPASSWNNCLELALQHPVVRVALASPIRVQGDGSDERRDSSC